MPKQGFGSSNDGNTARRFFDNPEITAEITKVEVEIIARFKVILAVLSSGHPINPLKFGEYSKRTEAILLDKYPHRKLTPTVHKILKHGEQIIRHNILPIGELSEEAQETKNKEYRKFRYNNTCKASRETQNIDLFRMLAVSSDPLISSLRPKQNKKQLRLTYSPDMIGLFEMNNSEALQEEILTLP